MHRSQSVDPYSKFKDLALPSGPKKILITDALGQLGSGLATTLCKIYGDDVVIMTDIVKARMGKKCEPFYYLDILNQSVINQMVIDHNIDTITHFSALHSAVGEANVPLALKYLSAPAEKLAHRTYNVTGYSFTPKEVASAVELYKGNSNIQRKINFLNSAH